VSRPLSALLLYQISSPVRKGPAVIREPYCPARCRYLPEADATLLLGGPALHHQDTASSARQARDADRQGPPEHSQYAAADVSALAVLGDWLIEHLLASMPAAGMLLPRAPMDRGDVMNVPRMIRVAPRLHPPGGASETGVENASSIYLECSNCCPPTRSFTNNVCALLGGG
jgi:hypothetical protein